METRPPLRPFWMVSFVIHATRGILRDQSTRRKAMGFSVLIAVLLVIAGSTFLRSTLNPHEHPGRFILFWFACAWMTMLVLLLALLDLLLTRAQARAARKLLREQFSQPPTPDSQTPPRHE